jgi:hypothetical protein
MRMSWDGGKIVQKFFKHLDKLHFEQTLTKFCKWILGVNRYTSNLGVKAELGLFPLLLFILEPPLRFLCDRMRVREMYGKGVLFQVKSTENFPYKS